MNVFSAPLCVLAVAMIFWSAVAHAQPTIGKHDQTSARGENTAPATSMTLERTRSQWQFRGTAAHRRGRTSLALPVTLLSVGAATMLLGGVVFAALGNKDCDVETCYPAAAPTGKALMISGAAVALVGLVVLPIRMIARQQNRALSAAPYLAEGASVSPWFSSGLGADKSMGLRGTYRF